MTIIRPNNHQKMLYNIILGALGAILIVLIWFGIVEYGNIVNLRHDVNLIQKNIRETELASSKLQNKAYGITDISNLEKKASELGLVKETNPQYLNLDGGAGNLISQKASLPL
ncbi:MAG: hypothetical protein Q8L47_05240 [bacterium]|nr:hypothetical protein [bacterium]